MTEQSPDPHDAPLSDHERTQALSGVLAQLRMMVLIVSGSLLALLVVLWFAVEGQVTDGTDDPIAWVLLVVGTIASIVGVKYARDVPLRAEDLGGFVGLLRTAIFIGLATAELPALLGFVASFLVGAVWPYLVGIIPSAIGLWLILPTPQRMRDLDRAFRAKGKDVPVADLLGDTRPAGP